LDGVKDITKPLILIIFLLSTPALAGDNCLHGCPIGSPEDNQKIEREIYTLSNNKWTKFADWVAYHVTKDTIGLSKARNWKSDPDLPANETLEPSDYRDANKVLKTDRGHQVPLAAFSGTRHWRSTNYLSNITPQKSNLNKGSWGRLETAIRRAANSDEGLYVMTGPLYDNSIEKLPKADEYHKVPTAYWKVVANDEGKVTAFVFNQDLSRSAKFCEQISSLAVVEQKAELDFFPEMLDWPLGSLEAELECN
jgi:endonuclease G, mitochondrial